MTELPPQMMRQLSDLQQKLGMVLIGIDGGGGAGKSTFAKRLSAQLPESFVVEVDDFYKFKKDRVTISENTPVHTNFDRPRLIEQVLEPLRNKQPAKFQIYNWKEDRLDPEWHTIEPDNFIIVEGLGTLGQDLRHYFDYKIWLQASAEVRRTRGIERDTEDWAAIWDNQYLPQDERYMQTEQPEAAADFIIRS